MPETPSPTRPPVSRIRLVIQAVLAAAALFTFVIPRFVSVAPHRLLMPFVVLVLFAPPLLPVRIRYKVATLVALVGLGPFLIPLPPLEGTSPARRLASAESRFFDTGAIEIHYQEAGTGELALMLLHPGQPTGLGTWHRVFADLAADFRVVAFDRPGSGLTAWPEDGVTGESPYSSEAQADQTVALMDHLGIERAVLIGNSAGGTIALLAALNHPDRVSGLVLIAPGVYFGANDGSRSWVRALLGTPQGRRMSRLLVRGTGDLQADQLLDSFWHDPTKQEDEDKESVLLTFKVEHYDRAFTELFRTALPLGLPERLGQVRVPVLVLAGDDDKWVPLDHNQRLARELPEAQLEVVEDCGHLPQQEQPEVFLQRVKEFVSGF